MLRTATLEGWTAGRRKAPRRFVPHVATRSRPTWKVRIRAATKRRPGGRPGSFWIQRLRRVRWRRRGALDRSGARVQQGAWAAEHFDTYAGATACWEGEAA